LRQSFESSGNREEAAEWKLSHIREYLDAKGRPDRRRTIHVAGTNGKGSTAVMLESIARAMGAHTLLETSPHMAEVRERIAINGVPLDEVAFARGANALLKDPDCARWTFFELVTVLGWIAAAELGCDWQVLEVGLGGRLDTTNAVLSKDVAVITALDLEHTDILGDTLRQIAAEKAGIITCPCYVVASPSLPLEAVQVVSDRAREVGAELHRVSDECSVRWGSASLDSQVFSVRTPVREYRTRLALLGAHQQENAATAIRAAELAFGADLDEARVCAALASVRHPGRFEVLHQQPLILLDALHTGEAAAHFRRTVEQMPLPRPRALVFAALRDKHVSAIAEQLVSLNVEVYVAPVNTLRSADPEQLATCFREHGATVHVSSSILFALRAAKDSVGRGGCVLVAGGVHTVGEARAELLASAAVNEL
jgi:dihydrofolate synthase/folylpolyglutamate synthase